MSSYNAGLKRKDHIATHHTISTGLDGIMTFRHRRSFSAEQRQPERGRLHDDHVTSTRGTDNL